MPRKRNRVLAARRRKRATTATVAAPAVAKPAPTKPALPITSDEWRAYAARFAARPAPQFDIEEPQQERAPVLPRLRVNDARLRVTRRSA